MKSATDLLLKSEFVRKNIYFIPYKITDTHKTITINNKTKK